ncbi:MAG: Dyp-type peroxidase [Pseudonocardiales bacterium]|nr:Dyp-type peroxidase [Pseudonocardiales bacterium]
MLIPATAHVRLAAPETNSGAVIIRRAFSYNNGCPDPPRNPR